MIYSRVKCTSFLEGEREREREDVEVGGGGKSGCVVQTRWSSMEEVLCVRDRAPGSFL